MNKHFVRKFFDRPLPLIPHVLETSNINIRQEGRRRRRQRRRQRRREQREEEQRRRRQRPSELQLQQRHEPEQQPRRQRSRTWSEFDREQEYWWSIGFPEYMEENLTPLLEAYEWEKMDPKIRWEQEQLNELEGFVVLEQLALIDDENEQITVGRKLFRQNVDSWNIHMTVMRRTLFMLII